MQAVGLSQWFYLGVLAIVIGLVFVWKARGNSKSKTMENGYMLMILGFVGIVSEFTDFASVLLVLVMISGIILILDKLLWAKKRSESQQKLK